MDERDGAPAETAAWLLVHEAHTLLSQPFQFPRYTLNTVRNVVQALSTAIKEAGDTGAGARGRQELHDTAREPERDDSYAVLLQLLAGKLGRAEQPLVRLRSRIQVADYHADVVNTARVCLVHLRYFSP